MKVATSEIFYSIFNMDGLCSRKGSTKKSVRVAKIESHELQRIHRRRCSNAYDFGEGRRGGGERQRPQCKKQFSQTLSAAPPMTMINGQR